MFFGAGGLDSDLRGAGKAVGEGLRGMGRGGRWKRGARRFAAAGARIGWHFALPFETLAGDFVLGCFCYAVSD